MQLVASTKSLMTADLPADVVDQTLTFLALPTLETLTTNPIPPLRNISYVTLDDQEIAWKPEEEELAQAQAHGGNVAGVGVKGLDIGMCVVRRKAIGLYRLGAKLVFLRVSLTCSQRSG
jgi:hypothetical protein